MKYRPHKEQGDVLKIGDVRRCTINSGGEIESFYAAVMSISLDSVSVKRLYKEDLGTSRYLIRDVKPTGLEYAMFVDTRIMNLPKKTIGHKIGRISKIEMKIVRG